MCSVFGPSAEPPGLISVSDQPARENWGYEVSSFPLGGWGCGSSGNLLG